MIPTRTGIYRVTAKRIWTGAKGTAKGVEPRDVYMLVMRDDDNGLMATQFKSQFPCYEQISCFTPDACEWHERVAEVPEEVVACQP